MPAMMRPPRLAVLVLVASASLLLLSRVFLAASARPPTSPPRHASSSSSPSSSSSFSSSPSSTPQPTRSIMGLFFYNTPFSLFPPNAAISLTDDNSTSFAARPAAFGPKLASKGLSGQLWVGSGFTDDSLDSIGELGCSDVPGWDEGDASTALKLLLLRHPASASAPIHVRSVRSVRSDDTAGLFTSSSSSSSSSMTHADIQSIQEGAEIEGKIVLLMRGGCGFLEKIMWAQRRGAIAVIVGDNQRGGPLIQMFAHGDEVDNVTIPSVFTARTSAQLLSALAQQQPANSIEGHGKPKDGNGGQDPDTEESSSAGPRGGIVTPGSGEYKVEAEVEPGRAKIHSGEGDDDETDPPKDGEPLNPPRDGLWVTITPTSSASPFFDTLLVLVISPLVTLTIVYALLIVRARIRRRRWRAPKSVVDCLPVRTYHTVARSPSLSPRLPSPSSCSPTTPLLQQSPSRTQTQTQTQTRPRSQTTTAVPDREGLGLPPSVQAGTSASGPSSRPAGSGSGSSSRNPTTPSRRSKSKQERQNRAAAAFSAEWKKYMGRQIECVVCLEEYIDGVSRVMRLPCGHEFHADCITPWLTTRRRTCPICKGDVVRSLRGGSWAVPRYEPYRDDDGEDVEAEGSGYQSINGSSGNTIPSDPEQEQEQGTEAGPSERQPRRPQWQDGWLGMLSSSFSGVRSSQSRSRSSRSQSPSPEDRNRRS